MFRLRRVVRTMRFLYFTDTHVKSKAPEHRVDDYKESLLGVREVIPRMLDLFSEYGILKEEPSPPKEVNDHP